MTNNEKAGITSTRRILAKKIKLLRYSRGWSSATAPCVALPSHIHVGRRRNLPHPSWNRRFALIAVIPNHSW